MRKAKYIGNLPKSYSKVGRFRLLYRQANQLFLNSLWLSVGLIIFKAYFNLNSYFYNDIFSPRINILINKIPDNASFARIVTNINNIQTTLNINNLFPGFFTFVSVIFLIALGWLTILYLVLPLFKLGSVKQGMLYLIPVVVVGTLIVFATNSFVWGIPFVITVGIQTSIGMQMITPYVRGNNG